MGIGGVTNDRVLDATYEENGTLIQDDLVTFVDAFDVANASAYTDVSAVSSAVVCYRLGAEPNEYEQLPDGTLGEQAWYTINVPTVTCVKTVSPDDPSKLRFTCRCTVSIPDLMDNGIADVFVPVKPIITTVLTFTTAHETKNAVYEKALEAKDLVYRPVGNPEIVGLSCTIENEDSFTVGDITEDDSKEYFSILDQINGGRYYARLNLFTDSMSMNADDYTDIMAVPTYTIYWKDLATTGEHANEYDSYVYRYKDVWGVNKRTTRLVWNIAEKPTKHDFIMIPFWDMNGLNHPFVEGHSYDVYVSMELSVCGQNNVNYHTEEHVTNMVVETAHKTLTFCPEGSVPEIELTNETASIENESELKLYNGDDYFDATLLSANFFADISNPVMYCSGQNAGGYGLHSDTCDVTISWREHVETEDETTSSWNSMTTTCDLTAGDEWIRTEESYGWLEHDVSRIRGQFNDISIPDLYDVTKNVELDIKVDFTFEIDYGIDNGYTTHTKRFTVSTAKTLLYNGKAPFYGHVFFLNDVKNALKDPENVDLALSTVVLSRNDVALKTPIKDVFLACAVKYRTQNNPVNGWSTIFDYTYPNIDLKVNTTTPNVTNSIVFDDDLVQASGHETTGGLITGKIRDQLIAHKGDSLKELKVTGISIMFKYADKNGGLHSIVESKSDIKL